MRISSLLHLLIQRMKTDSRLQQTRIVIRIDILDLAHPPAQIYDHTASHTRCSAAVAEIPAHRDGEDGDEVFVGPEDDFLNFGSA